MILFAYMRVFIGTQHQFEGDNMVLKVIAIIINNPISQRELYVASENRGTTKLGSESLTRLNLFILYLNPKNTVK